MHKVQFLPDESCLFMINKLKPDRPGSWGVHLLFRLQHKKIEEKGHSIISGEEVGGKVLSRISETNGCFQGPSSSMNIIKDMETASIRCSSLCAFQWSQSSSPTQPRQTMKEELLVQEINGNILNAHTFAGPDKPIIQRTMSHKELPAVPDGIEVLQEEPFLTG
uniref:Uncharacterized protein n=1 Tax=Daphnia galeata TaxID=27404 RepID=A0A8J2WKT9_9CRUS|nr:unnamed protein product [Daphnia galeata]